MKNILQDIKEKWVLYASLFLIFGFIGWIFETTAVYLTHNTLTNRGFLFITEIALLNGRIIWGLPFIDMYGYGGILIVMFFSKLKDRPFSLFFLGAVSMTIFELIGGIWCRKVLRHDFWDYSNNFLNYNGYICLKSSIMWGILSILCIQLFVPLITKFEYRASQHKYYKYIVVILLVYIIILSLIKYFIFPGITLY